MTKRYEDWTAEETEKLLDAVGGVDRARMVIHYRTRKLIVATPVPIVGEIVKTLRLAPYKKSAIQAVQLGGYDSYDQRIVELFSGEDLELAQATPVHLVRFNVDLFTDEILAWVQTNGKKPMQAAHVFGVGAQHPEEQKATPIICLGEKKCVLTLNSCGEDSEGRTLQADIPVSANQGWACYCLFGFLDG